MTARTLDPTPGCPKRMVFGPCGGVRSDGSCELDAALPCPWCGPDAAVRPWPTRPPTGPVPVRPPRVLTDLSVPPYDLAALRDILGLLVPVSDALLVGEHHHRPDFPPTMLAAEILAVGGSPWITLTCRDRNRVVLEQELAGLAALGVGGVLCVTGDGRGQDVRPEVTQVFDLDSTRLAHLAAAAGVPAAVAVAPAAPPADLRPAALAEKQRAGASMAVANHVGSPAALAAFLDAARDAGADLPVIAGVAVYTDERSAAVLAAFPGLALDTDAVAAVLAAPDPREAGIAAAVAEAEALLAVPGVVGVNLSGLASADGWRAGAEVKAEVAARIGNTPA
ncbi:methylenetetrahydrofolate reductase C-terminal domain-containing protein [Actinomycetospora lemnae]|uniref:Methylenetetrahydrofolate reductase n=1 Tax=Actinomycetospora lemnae TaxID=3019891 RepID=A0ABT5T1M7_9PSEU|nr:methylenetetrahydrofolate reductase C-terminal domain-containing protein [Actinomycetospora sp. DW7H6]MDD7969022.1 methylenetetrahydrofolate reductase C-terminal domain-containing protein [Actinomycetospora sp. DW7H6]